VSDIEPGSVRAGNTDREKVVARLNTAFAEGRLDVTELDERVAAAYGAKTLGELVPLTADLPAEQPYRPGPGAAPARRERTPARTRRGDDHRWVPVGAMVGVFLLNVLIWAAIAITSDDGPYFWPVWLLIPVFVTAMGALGRGHGGHR
jgi:hypothetical protein